MHFAYIIYSESYNIFYTGYSERPYKRLIEHNEGLSRYARGKGPWKLVYLEAFKTKKEALKREKQLKREIEHIFYG
jgi:putative endonuclease